MHVRGVVMREARGPEWTDWLAQNGVVALTGVDTRSLVLHLRDGGAMRAAIAAGEVDVEETLAAVRALPGMDGRSLAAGSRPTSRTASAPARDRTSRSSTTGASARSSAASPGAARP